MTVEELILLDKAKVRRDSNLMHLYLEHFKTAFGRIPNCAGCSFGTDWSKLVAKYSKNYVTLQKGKPMKTIQIKKIAGKILTYKKDGRTYRQYDNILTDAFIKEFIVSGTEEENKERVKMFNFPIETIEVEETKKPIKIVVENAEAYEDNKQRVIPIISEDNRAILNDGFVPKKRGPKKRK